MDSFGLIAGAGRFPLIFAEEAKTQGIHLVVIALKDIASPDIEKIADRVHWISVGELQRLIDILKTESVKEVVMAGKIQKTLLYSGTIAFDARLKLLLSKIDNNNDDSILLALVNEIQSEGITVCESTKYVNKLLIQDGVLTSDELRETEWQDVYYGWNIAKQIAGLDIGQTVIVKDRAVLAVEAIEGTDEAISRGGALGKGGVVVAKVSKPNQDKRFDMPVIGMNTINVMLKAGAVTLVVDAGKTIFLDKENVINFARSKGVRIVAL
ncbi:MAG TPA: UDP-2,3-diacylglucosamine diphosphatase LpxI [Candidatus Wallbacteria bacterium]|nr:UDP-2,3-diacylglucosamine diphosphatase LpxI [Candidatus Wallbacteria bacterium]